MRASRCVCEEGHRKYLSESKSRFEGTALAIFFSSGQAPRLLSLGTKSRETACTIRFPMSAMSRRIACSPFHEITVRKLKDESLKPSRSLRAPMRIACEGPNTYLCLVWLPCPFCQVCGHACAFSDLAAGQSAVAAVTALGVHRPGGYARGNVGPHPGVPSPVGASAHWPPVFANMRAPLQPQECPPKLPYDSRVA